MTTKLRLDDIDDLARAVVAMRRDGRDLTDIVNLLKAQSTYIQKRFRLALGRETFRAVNHR